VLAEKLREGNGGRVPPEPRPSFFRKWLSTFALKFISQRGLFYKTGPPFMQCEKEQPLAGREQDAGESGIALQNNHQNYAGADTALQAGRSFAERNANVRACFLCASRL